MVVCPKRKTVCVTDKKYFHQQREIFTELQKINNSRRLTLSDYFELVINCKLKEDTSKEIIELLQYLTNQTDKQPEQWPEHPLFAEDRRHFATGILMENTIIFGIGYGTGGFANVIFDSTDYFLVVRNYIKDSGYDEIELFLNWLAPYCDINPYNEPYCVGYFRHPRDRHLSLIYFDSKGTAYYLDNTLLENIHLEPITED
jgi:hypothetical protein